MSYKSAKNQTSKKFFLGVVLLIFVLFFLRRPILNIFSSASYAVASPVWGLSQFLDGEITEGFLLLQSKDSLVKNLVNIQKDFMSFDSLRLEYIASQKENNELKEQLNLKKTFGFEKTARVLVKPPQTSYDSIVIDVGAQDGVVEGDSVFVGQNVLLGRVSKAYPSTALVEMISSAGVSTEARLLLSELSLPLVGQGGGSFKVEIPRDTPIDESDFFVSSFDMSVVLAEVVKIIGDPQDPVKTIIAKTPFNIHYASHVFVKRQR
jgi:cell shape-determining protein MreC